MWRIVLELCYPLGRLKHFFHIILKTVLKNKSPSSHSAIYIHIYIWLPGWHSGKEFACNAEDLGDTGFIPGSGRCPGGGNGNPLQYSCLGNPTDRGTWQAQSMRSQRVGHNWACTHTHTHSYIWVYICVYIYIYIYLFFRFFHIIGY